MSSKIFEVIQDMKVSPGPLFNLKMKEIERKFLVTKLPDLSNLKPVEYERYFLEITDNSETRVQKKGNKFELETKTNISNLKSIKEKKEITEEKFEELKQKTTLSIIRTSYLLSKDPETSIKIYHNNHKGLIRLEVEFNSEKAANEYNPPSWAKTEITKTKLGRDSKLITLTKEEFNKLINTLK